MVDIKRIYDLPKVGPILRKLRYRKIFDIRPGEVAIDCGANVGNITKKMAVSGREIYAFEPDQSAFKALLRNTSDLHNVTCFNKAVSDHNGVERIYFNDRYKEAPEKWSTGSTLLADKPHVDKENFALVEVIDLALFIKKLGKPVGLLKIDIEGEEVKVLNKLIDTGLASEIRKIVVETHERFPSLEQATKELRQRIARERLKNIDLDWA